MSIQIKICDFEWMLLVHDKDSILSDGNGQIQNHDVECYLLTWNRRPNFIVAHYGHPSSIIYPFDVIVVVKQIYHLPVMTKETKDFRGF